MARGDSIIRVSIIGDVKGLTGALGQAETSVGGLATKVGGVLIGLGLVRTGFQFLEDSTVEADRLADALTRINIQLGPELTGDLEDTAAGFVDIGASKQDILELEANFADLGTTIGLTNDEIALTAPQVAAIATAISLLEDVEPSTVIEQIGKAANGSEKAALALGVTLLDNVDASTQLANILDQLKPKLDAVTTGSKDLELQQAKLDAEIETLQANIGGPLNDALAATVGFINDEIDALPGAIEGWKGLAGVYGTILSPLARLVDLYQTLAGININNIPGMAPGTIAPGRTPRGSPGSGPTDAQTAAAVERQRERNGLGK